MNEPISSWRNRPAKHQPVYDNLAKLNAVRNELSKRPPLVFAGEVDALRDLFAKAEQAQAFVLIGGDCAETFAESTADQLRLKMQTLLQMAIVLTYGSQMPVVKIGRIAGQYAKPRSSPTETIDSVTLPSYMGDAVNGFEFNEESRKPDPWRLLRAYEYSASSFNIIRAFTKGGYADLRQVQRWNQGFMKNPAYARYEDLAAQINRTIKFMEAAGADFDSLKQVDLFSSHEALLLEYESALARIDSLSNKPYATSAHYLWVGERTRGSEEAHLDFLSQVENPVGVKVGPTATKEQIQAIIDKLNPHGVPGRLSLIARMGAEKITDKLPELIEVTKADGRPLCWITDPMHGNTYSSENGYKTRNFDTIMSEIMAFFAICQDTATVPAGIHIELTGDDVTEIVGGAENLDAKELPQKYTTLVDPRLNHQQALEIAFLVAELAERFYASNSKIECKDS